jgi:large subunit ribosomal protein L17
VRHQKYKGKIGTSPSHRKSLLRNLAISLIDHEKIKTTHAKSKAVKGYVEKLVTLAKTDTVSNRRLAYARINNRTAVQKLFNTIAPKFKERPGGYTRISKLADGRVGDGSKMSYLSFVE